MRQVNLMLTVRRILLTGLVLMLISAGSATAQISAPDKPDISMPRLMDSTLTQRNFYDFAGNPASLLDDESAKAIWFGTQQNGRSGSFHTTFDPGSQYGQSYFTGTILPLTTIDLFKGYFTYQHQSDRSVMWADQNRNMASNPFVLGDSSTGDFILNGLSWAAEWSHEISHHWLGGISFAYQVDQRMKNVFPKPLNKHRDMLINAGLQYSFKEWKFGLSYERDDQQEKVEITKYSLDQNLTPVLFKFRFDDLPVVLHGQTSEERTVNRIQNSMGGQMLWQHKTLLFMMAYRHRFADGEVYDGGSQRTEQGKFSRKSSELSTRLDYVSMGKQFSIIYSLQSHFDEARHPDFGMTIFKQPILLQQAAISARAGIFGLPVFTDIGWTQRQQNHKDLITGNIWQFNQNGGFIRSGTNMHFSQRWDFSGWVSAAKFKNSEVHQTDLKNTEYYDVLYLDRLNYYLARDYEYHFGMRIVYHYLPMLDAELTGQYLTEIPNKDFKAGTRRILFGGFWLKLYIF